MCDSRIINNYYNYYRLSASFVACVEECISERESWKFEEGLNTKVKLDMYKRFG